jgi:hypothetical protein
LTSLGQIPCPRFLDYGTLMYDVSSLHLHCLGRYMGNWTSRSFAEVAATISCPIRKLQIRRSSRKMANPLGRMGLHVLRNRNRGNRQNDQDCLDDNLVPFRQLFQAQTDVGFAHKRGDYLARWPPEKVS